MAAVSTPDFRATEAGSLGQAGCNSSAVGLFGWLLALLGLFTATLPKFPPTPCYGMILSGGGDLRG